MLCAATGGTGFIGSVLVTRLAERGDHIRLLARHGSDVTPFLGFPNVEIVRGDLFDGAALRKLCAGADVLFHLAADLSFWRGARAAQDHTNIEGTRFVMDAARLSGVRRVIYTSSVAAVGLPANPGIPANENNPFAGWQFPAGRRLLLQTEFKWMAANRNTVFSRLSAFTTKTIRAGSPWRRRRKNHERRTAEI